MRRRIALSLTGIAGVALVGSAFGQETTTFSYDAQGRLTGTATTGGPNNARQTGTCFDRAGNRTRYDLSTSPPAPCPTPTPTYTPPP